MPHIPDFSDPRYLDEVGWFLYHEKYARDRFGGSYDAERLAYSRLLRDEVLAHLGCDAPWFEDKTVVTIGCGCTGDLAAFPAGVKIAVDPLLYAYQQLGMLLPDEVGAPTVHLSVGCEDLPLLDECADLVICRNALDHMPAPDAAMAEIWRILGPAGFVFISVDVGGTPTPDEPTVFSADSLRALLQKRFEVPVFTEDHPSHSVGRLGSLRVVAQKAGRATPRLDKRSLLHAYEARLPQTGRV